MDGVPGFPKRACALAREQLWGSIRTVTIKLQGRQMRPIERARAWAAAEAEAEAGGGIVAGCLHALTLFRPLWLWRVRTGRLAWHRGMMHRGLGRNSTLLESSIMEAVLWCGVVRWGVSCYEKTDGGGAVCTPWPGSFNICINGRRKKHKSVGWLVGYGALLFRVQLMVMRRACDTTVAKLYIGISWRLFLFLRRLDWRFEIFCIIATWRYETWWLGIINE